MARARDPQVVSIEMMFTPAGVDAEKSKAIESLSADFKRLAMKVHKAMPRAGREKSLVLSHLQDAKFHAVHGITHPPVDPPEAVKAAAAPAKAPAKTPAKAPAAAAPAKAPAAKKAATKAREQRDDYEVIPINRPSRRP